MKYFYYLILYLLLIYASPFGPKGLDKISVPVTPMSKDLCLSISYYFILSLHGTVSRPDDLRYYFIYRHFRMMDCIKAYNFSASCL